MITSFLSTASLTEATRTSLAKSQAKIAEAQKELASGRHADVGRTLGVKSDRVIFMRQQHSQLKNIIDTNAVLSTRLDLTQSALQSLSDAAGSFLSAVIAGGSSTQAAVTAKRAAEDAVKTITDVLNTAEGGAYLFSGLNSDRKPIADYFATPASASMQAVDLAFLTQFGFAQTDPAAGGISATDMQTYLDGPFAALFDSASWDSTWSDAASTNLQSRISPGEVIESSVNANAEPIRKLMEAMTMIAGTGVDRLSGSARKSVFDKATRLAGEAIAGINGMRSGLGLAQERVESASQRLSVETDILAKEVGRFERVDPAEVSVRISALTTQIEASYALTARLHQLSLVNYL